jgi:hypothetical protein
MKERQPRSLSRTTAVAILVLASAVFLIAYRTLSAATIRVQIDPRVELMSIVFRLAGNPEYNQSRVASYVADVDKHFGRIKGHAVVARIQSLRASRGISFNAPMSLAVYLADAENLGERVPLDPLPPRVDEACAFRRVSSFDDARLGALFAREVLGFLVRSFIEYLLAQ